MVWQNQVAAAAPIPAGGTITAGKYLLTKNELYTGVGGATGQVDEYDNETLVIGANTADAFYEWGRANGPRVSQAENRTFVTNGSDITFTVKCPAGVSGIAAGYTAEATKLVLVVGTARVLTYTHQ